MSSGLRTLAAPKNLKESDGLLWNHFFHPDLSCLLWSGSPRVENTTPRYRRTCFACCHPVQYHHVASPREVLPQGQKNHRRKGNKYLEFPIMGSQVWVIKLVGFTCMKVGNGLSKEREICLCSGEKSQSRLQYHYAFT